ncbi:hypothetical protein [Microbacterium sp. PRC9]|uniref:TolB family protein n=1 Tax=Microbacterium sp. PRC9 TaxID=2962591 RepID=UPI002881ACD5|nr:hypothetical protein [Microbacterium sp. PRC9]MDT0144573.1 hypothetical protein [Microbacterium sp. PRC9]
MSWARTLSAGQTCRVHIFDAATGESQIVHEDATVLLEAPNWTLDGQLILNGDGVFWRLPVDASAAPSRIPHHGLPENNNDHVLSPDSLTVFASCNDGHIYAAPVEGGHARRVTRGDPGLFHYLHGVSPDGTRLAYVALDFRDESPSGTVHTVGVDGADDAAVTTGVGPDDGPEYNPAGDWLYLNTERFSESAGHAQIAKVRLDGTGLTQLTFDERANWFPHLNRDGTRAVYLSYPPGTQGHPADLAVTLRLVDLSAGDDAWAEAPIVANLLGGQGTINVNSWSPDGTRFAYVDYPSTI